jgi:hypothetical protein
MSIVLDGTNGITAPAFDGAVDATDLTGDVAAARITSALNATGSAPLYACRAWVNFNGTGTVAIRASGNVSSITDNGVGEYTINFTTAMPDANYALSGAAVGVVGTSFSCPVGENSGSSNKTVLSVRIETPRVGSTASLFDSPSVSVAIFR